MAYFPTLMVALAALFWGLSGGLGALLMADGWHASVIAFYRGAIGLLFVLIWLGLSRHTRGFTSRRLWLWSIIAGLGIAGNFTFYFLSIAEGSIAVAATLMYCAPIFVYAVSFLLGLEAFTAFKVAAIALVMLGIALLTGVYDPEPGGVTLLGMVTGVLAGLSYAVFIFGFKFAAAHGSPQMILAVALTTLVLLLPWLGQGKQMLAALHTPDWPLFLALGVLGAGLSFFLYIVGLKNTAPAAASVVAMVEPVTASLFGVLVMGERLQSLQLAGMVLILVTVTALSTLSGTRRPARSQVTN
ncbi:DMT family transporter [Marinobacteraceae bacterium S3BR75-40.1]